MMKSPNIQETFAYLTNLVGKPLIYAIKSPDTELYDFGFGEIVESLSPRGRKRKTASHVIHVLCNFKVIHRTTERHVYRYYNDTPKDQFESDIKSVLGRTVVQVAISDKNDLLLDLGSHRIIFVTNEDSIESWRYFIIDKNAPHLVASDVWIEFH